MCGSKVAVDISLGDHEKGPAGTCKGQEGGNKVLVVLHGLGGQVSQTDDAFVTEELFRFESKVTQDTFHTVRVVSEPGKHEGFTHKLGIREEFTCPLAEFRLFRCW